MRQLRVLVVRREFPKASETFVQTEIIGLIEHGAAVRILAEAPLHGVFHPDFVNFDLQGKTIYNLNYFDGCQPPGIEQLTQVLNDETLAREQMRHYQEPRFQPDIIWTPHGTTGAIRECRCLSEWLKIPFVVTFRADDIYVGLDPENRCDAESIRRSLNRRMAVPLLEDAAAILTTSAFNQKALSKFIPPGRKVEVYHSGVDPEYFCPAADPGSAGNRILCVARFEPKKGIEHLIRAARILQDRQVSFHLGIIGLGPLEQRYRTLIADLGLESVVTVTGPLTLDSVLAELQRASVFVLPSVITPAGSRDVFATALQEAMSCELAVITTDLPGNEELVRHEENGLMVPMGQAAALADALQQALGSPELRQRLGRNARATIIAKFNARDTKRAIYTHLAELSGVFA